MSQFSSGLADIPFERSARGKSDSDGPARVWSGVSLNRRFNPTTESLLKARDPIREGFLESARLLAGDG